MVTKCQAPDDSNKTPGWPTPPVVHKHIFRFMTLTFVTSRPLSTGRMPSAGRPSHISQPTLNVAQHGTTRSANLYSTQAEARCRRARASRVRWGMLGSELSDHSSRSRRYTQWSQMTRAFSSWRLHTSPPRACQQASLSCTCLNVVVKSCVLAAVATSGVSCNLSKADSVQGKMFHTHEVMSAHTMSDICNIVLVMVASCHAQAYSQWSMKAVANLRQYSCLESART